MSLLEEVRLTVEEFEALRLAHAEDLYQEAAAREMGISRPTFGRLLDQAHRKVTRVLCEGLALRIEGGSYRHQEPEPGPPCGAGPLSQETP